jgi:penicillin amidase
MGNIGYYPAALYPIRGNVPVIEVGGVEIPNHGFLPFNGSRGEGEWIGFIDFEEIPHVLNPEKGYVVTANNKVVGRGYPYYLGWHWADRFRAQRIVELIESILAEKGYVTVEDMMRVQTDTVSLAAKTMLSLILGYVNAEALEPVEAEALELLRTWNYAMSSGRPEPLIYATWLIKLHEAVWKDELEAAGIRNLKLLPLEVTEYVIRAAMAGLDMDRWLDAPLTDVVTSSFKEAIRLIRESYGDDPAGWRWGEACMYRIEHPLGIVLSWLNYPLIPASGGPFTVSPAGIGLTSPKYWVKSSASIRFIASLKDASPENNYLILPGGNIGRVFSEHYMDQLSLYVNMGYKPFYIPRDVAEVREPKAIYVFRGG